MKTKEKKEKSGMTLVEIAVLITVFLSLIFLLFIGARS
jgi:competence protein ComGC